MSRTRTSDLHDRLRTLTRLAAYLLAFLAVSHVRIGGIDQWVSIRGIDRKNPVLLYIHGGPGYVSIPMSWWFTRGLEEYFTVVQWDQRATGKDLSPYRSSEGRANPDK
jgi:proline iminopeptidase